MDCPTLKHIAEVIGIHDFLFEAHEAQEMHCITTKITGAFAHNTSEKEYVALLLGTQKKISSQRSWVTSFDGASVEVREVEPGNYN